MADNTNIPAWQPYVNIERYAQFYDEEIPRVAISGIMEAAEWDGLYGNKGWKLTSDTAYFYNVVVRGSLSAVSFQRHAVHAAGGSLWITPTTVLTRGVAETDSTIYVRDYILESGDILIMTKDFENIEYIRVESMHTVIRDIDPKTLVGEYSYNVTRAICGTTVGAYSLGNVISVYVRAPDPDNPAKPAGMIALEADVPYSPYMDIIERNGPDCDDVQTRVRIGNLDGIDDPDLNPFGFGFYGDNVFIRGILFLSEDGTAFLGPIGGDTTRSIIHGYVLVPGSVDATHLSFSICEYISNNCPPAAGLTNISPEYPGALLVGDSGSNIGTMTTGFDYTYFHAYYHWAGGMDGIQDYDIILRAQFPGEWRNTDSTWALRLTYQTSDAVDTESKVDLYIYDTANNLWLSSTSLVNTSWTVEELNRIPGLGGTWIEKDWFTILIKLSARGAKWARVSELELNF